MKTATTLPAPALSYKPRVKKFLTKGIIHLTSQKFSIFVTGIAAMISYIGVILDDDHLIAYGGIVFLIGFTTWSIREILRDTKREKLGLNNDKW